MKVRAVHILLDGRSKTVPLPDGCGQPVIKIETDEGLVEVPLPNKSMPAASMKRLRVATERKRRQSAANIVKAREAQERKNEEYREIERGFFARLSPPQHVLAEALFKCLAFQAKGGDGFSHRLGWWIGNLLQVCPEPWRLDWQFVRDWLYNPNAISNAARTRDGKSPTMPRRAVARNLFRDAWREQVGPITVPADVDALRPHTPADVESGHPFAVVYVAIQDGSLTGATDVLQRVKQYREAHALTDDEVRQAEEMVEQGVWLGDLSIPRS